MLSAVDKKILLETARKTIEKGVRGKTNLLPEIIPKSLMEFCGAFVTLHKFGELRGCIGYIKGVLPLIETVKDAAAKAALEDNRFAPVTKDELSDIDIEISVLSPLKLIKEINEIEIGKHGILIEYHHNHGLLLPQVATGYDWDRETFLNQAARKAGLSTDRLKDSETKIYIFTADIFGEKEKQ